LSHQFAGTRPGGARPPDNNERVDREKGTSAQLRPLSSVIRALQLNTVASLQLGQVRERRLSGKVRAWRATVCRALEPAAQHGTGFGGLRAGIAELQLGLGLAFGLWIGIGIGIEIGLWSFGRLGRARDWDWDAAD